MSVLEYDFLCSWFFQKLLISLMAASNISLLFCNCHENILPLTLLSADRLIQTTTGKNDMLMILHYSSSFCQVYFCWMCLLAKLFCLSLDSLLDSTFFWTHFLAHTVSMSYPTALKCQTFWHSLINSSNNIEIPLKRYTWFPLGQVCMYNDAEQPHKLWLCPAVRSWILWSSTENLSQTTLKHHSES